MQNTAFNSRAFCCPAFEPMFPLVGGVESAYAVGFDGTDDYIEVPHATALNLTGDCAFSFWFKTNNASSQALISKRAGSDFSCPYQFWLIGAKVSFTLGEGSSYAEAQQAGTVSAGVWNHVVGVVSGTTVTLYVNGLPVGTDTFSGTRQTNTSYLAIGRHGTSNAIRLNGAIDELRIYNRALSADEVSSMYINNSSPPTSGLVFYLPLDEGTGTTVTDTIGGLTGTLTNGPTWEPQVAPRLKIGRDTEQSWSGSFSRASTQYVSVPNAGVVSAEATYSVWVKPLDYSANGQVFYFNDGTEVDIHLMTNGYLLGYLYKSGYKAHLFSASGTVCPLNQWTHVAFTYDGTTVKWYVNGRLNNSTAQAGAVSPGSAATMDIGRSGPTGGKWNGLLKDARKYSSALSAADIAKLANNVEPGITMAGHWKLDEGTGTTATDSSGNGNHGTLTNGPTWSGDIPQWFRPTIESSHALSCDGSNDYVSVASALVAAAPCTLMCWFNSSSVAADQTLLSVGQSANETNYFALRAAGAVASDPVQAVASSLSEAAAASASGYTASAWHHAAAVFASTTSRTAYLNGVAGTANTTSKTPASLGATAIGRLAKQTPSEYAAASIDEACIYSRALTAAEIADAAAGYLVSAGLVSRYKLDNNANDAHGLNHGTAQGGVGYSTTVPGSL